MSTKDLSKMGSARVTLEELDGELCIRKQGAGGVEISFYQHAAQHLSGVHSPKLLAVKGDDLYIEYIPHSLKLTELQITSDVYQQLSRIHQSQYVPSFKVKEHCWHINETETALASLKLPLVTQDISSLVMLCLTIKLWSLGMRMKGIGGEETTVSSCYSTGSVLVLAARR